MEPEKARGRDRRGRRRSTLNVLCQDCGKTPATVSLTEIVNGAQRRLWLCAPCLEARNPFLSPIIPPSAAELPLTAPSAEETPTPAPEPASDDVCPSCGMTMKEFREKGRLGCPRDYDVFEIPLAAILRKEHGADVHCGRQPAAVRERALLRERLEALRRELEDAVKGEQYEQAARIRDRIRDLERADSEESRA